MPEITGLIAKMMVEEKAELCSSADTWCTKGIERLGIPEITMANGPFAV